MCGIALIINKNNTGVDASEITSMNNLASHRGPDDERYHFGSNFAFGHRRLAIVDQKNAIQPMEAEGYVVVFNGEIYNYQEIKTQLQHKNISFITDSDTEVLLKAYIHFGKDFVRLLDGMWSFLIYDPHQNAIFGSRDRFGMKPFYYARDEKRFYIASEIKQILPFLPRSIGNTPIIMDYLFGALEEHTEETFFNNILKLLPGHHLHYDLDAHTYSIEQYYDLSEAPTLPEDIPAEVFKQVNYAVQLRTQTTVKAGIMLSGGLDSSILAACLSHNDIKAIHASGSDEKDETKFASKVATHLNLALATTKPHINEWTKEVDEVINVQEEPFGSPSVIMQYKLMQFAKQDGIKILLDGQGADELFLGYRPYFFKILQTKSLSEKIELVKSNKHFVSKNYLKTILYYYFYKYDILKRLYFNRHKKYIHKSVFKYFMPEKYIQKSGSRQNMSAWQITEIQNLQLPCLLKYEDKNAMSQSIETRLPYLDHQLASLAVHIPEDWKINKEGTKYALRKAFENKLPAEIIWRKDKIGFEAPFQWLMQFKTGMLAEIKVNSFLAKIVNQKYLSETTDLSLIWRLYCLCRWSSVYNITNIYT